MSHDAKRPALVTPAARNHIDSTSTPTTVQPPASRAPVTLTRATRRECELAADVALARGQMVPLFGLGMVVVPDVLLLEGIAHGLDVPPSATVRRADGRSARIYRLPTMAVA